MKDTRIPIIGFAAYSGTGKTTLLTQLIPILKQQNIKVGLIKHSHHSFEIDKPEKDSYKLRKSGASTVLLVSNHKRAIITEFEKISTPTLSEQVEYLKHEKLDLILVEGFKREPIPKIELYRPALNHPLLFPYDSNIFAVASDTQIKLTPENTGLDKDRLEAIKMPYILDLNNPKQIANIIIDQVL